MLLTDFVHASDDVVEVVSYVVQVSRSQREAHLLVLQHHVTPASATDH